MAAFNFSILSFDFTPSAVLCPCRPGSVRPAHTMQMMPRRERKAVDEIERKDQQDEVPEADARIRH
jgi:hypothetical protein